MTLLETARLISGNLISCWCSIVCLFKFKDQLTVQHIISQVFLNCFPSWDVQRGECFVHVNFFFSGLRGKLFTRYKSGAEKKRKKICQGCNFSNRRLPPTHLIHILSIRFLKLLISDGRVSNFAGPSRVLISTTLVADSWVNVYHISWSQTSLFWLSTLRKIGSGILYVWLESSYCVHVYVRWQDTSHFQCLSLPRGTNHYW